MLSPTITDQLTLDGTTESAFLGKPAIVQINGYNLRTDGLILGSGSSGSTIKGLDVANFIAGAGINIQSASTGDFIYGNTIGIDTDGTSAAGNLYGIRVEGSTGNFLGGAGAGQPNTIGFNTTGVQIDSGGSGNQVIGNFIGTDSTGTHVFANANGIVIDSSNSNTVLSNLLENSSASGVLLTASNSANPPSSNTIGPGPPRGRQHNWPQRVWHSDQRQQFHLLKQSRHRQLHWHRLGRRQPAQCGRRGDRRRGGQHHRRDDFAGDPNTIGFNTTGVSISGTASNNVVLGNLIGTNSTSSTTPQGNAYRAW